jgi:hypothetical protein
MIIYNIIKLLTIYNMKTTELKKAISKEFDIPVGDLRIRNRNGWVDISIRKEQEEKLNLKQGNNYRDFYRKLNDFVVKTTDTYTFTADDGYGTELDCVLIEFSDFEYL